MVISDFIYIKKNNCFKHLKNIYRKYDNQKELLFPHKFHMGILLKISILKKLATVQKQKATIRLNLKVFLHLEPKNYTISLFMEAFN